MGKDKKRKDNGQFAKEDDGELKFFDPFPEQLQNNVRIINIFSKSMFSANIIDTFHIKCQFLFYLYFCYPLSLNLFRKLLRVLVMVGVDDILGCQSPDKFLFLRKCKILNSPKEKLPFNHVSQDIPFNII